MKKAVILFVLCVFTVPRAGWERVTEFNGYIDLNSVSFPNAQYGWVAGTEEYNTTGSKRNYMAYTRDGGTTWAQVQDAPSSGPVYFLDNNRGVAYAERFRPEVTNSKDIIKTIDGGMSWDVAFASVNNTTNFFFVSPDTGYTFSPSVVHRTVDGGATWPRAVLHASGSSNESDWRFTGASFINSRAGWFVWRKRLNSNISGSIYSTIDGGETCKLDTAYTVNNERKRLPDLRSVGFISENTGYIGGDSGFFARTTNGGETWDLRSFDNSYGAIKKILFVNSTAGWILSDNKLAMTLDGGNTWKEVSITGVNIKTCTEIFFSDANHGWIVGGGNLICRTTDNGGHQQPVSVNPTARVKRQTSAAAFSIRQLSGQKGRLKIAYKLNQDAALSLSVYDLKGVRTAFTPKRQQSAGEHVFSFNAPKGFYIIEAKVQGKTGETNFAEKILVR